MHERIRDFALRTLGRWSATHPWFTIVTSVTLAGVCVAMTLGFLEFHTDRSDLVDPEIAWNRRYATYREAYPRWDDLIVCLEGDADDVRIDDLARDLADRLRAEACIAAADAGAVIGPDQAPLFRVADEATFRAALAEFADARTLAMAEDAGQALALATAGLESAPRGEDDAAALGQLEALLDPYLAALEGGEPDFWWMTTAVDVPTWEPFVSSSGRIRFVMVHLETEAAGATVAGLGELLDRVRVMTGEVVGAGPLPELPWGVTGVPAIEADETTQSIRDSTVASIAAMVCITVLMIAVFRGVMVPLLAAATLLIGMAWSFGWLVLTVGHLQLLSVIFTVILLGLGIDFALHLVARLELVKEEHADLPGAVARVFGGIGPGLLTGALTTAAAFGAVAFTDFKGMAEMGIIAAGGIMLCLLATLTFFPAALAATRSWKRVIRHRRGGEQARFARGLLDGVDRHPLRVLITTSMLVLVLGVGAFKVRYDPNVLNLHPPDIESVQWERRVIEDGAMSVWAAIYTVRPDAIGPLAARLRDLPVVSEIGGAGVYFPPDLDEREASIAAVRESTPMLPPPAAGFASVRGQVAALRVGLRAAERDFDTPPRRLGVLLARIEAALSTSATVAADEQARRWDGLQAAFLAGRTRLDEIVTRALHPGRIRAEDLPPAVREQLVGRDGTWILRVFPARDGADRSILHPARLGPFVTALREVDPDVLGPPVQIFESSRLITREYTKAALYAIAVILVLLMLDFRSLVDALCSLLPVTIGFVGAFGIMGLTGTPLNFANIIVLPIIFGIGVDAGVHVVHRWRAEPLGCPAGLSGGTGRGITMTMAATIIGFACMLLAEHRGIRSLGLVMVAGLGVTLIACCTALPCLLHLRATPDQPTPDHEDVAEPELIAAAPGVVDDAD